MISVVVWGVLLGFLGFRPDGLGFGIDLFAGVCLLGFWGWVLWAVGLLVGFDCCLFVGCGFARCWCLGLVFGWVVVICFGWVLVMVARVRLFECCRLWLCLFDCHSEALV